MNYDEVKLRRLIGKCQWTFAKTMPTCPHEYSVRNKCALSDEEFVFFVQSQREFGVPQQWWKYNFPYLHINEKKKKKKKNKIGKKKKKKKKKKNTTNKNLNTPLINNLNFRFFGADLKKCA